MDVDANLSHVEMPWTPPFDMPDYKTLGRALLRVAHGERVDDSLDLFYAQDIERHIDSAQLFANSGAFEPIAIPLPEMGELLLFYGMQGKF